MTRILFMVRKKAFKYVAKMSPGRGLRIWLLRHCNYEIGHQVYIGEDLIIIDDLKDPKNYLVIGDRVAISPRVTFVLETKPNWSRIAPYVNSRKGAITIEKDSWIGTGAVILPDVTVGEGSVVAANAVVTRDVPPYSVVGGVPAKKIGRVNVPWYQHADMKESVSRSARDADCD